MLQNYKGVANASRMVIEGGPAGKVIGTILLVVVAAFLWSLLMPPRRS